MLWDVRYHLWPSLFNCVDFTWTSDSVRGRGYQRPILFGFFSKLMLLFLHFIPHLEIEYIASVSEARGKICKQVTGEETVWHWNVFNLSFCCSKMEDHFRFWSAKSQTNPLFTKQEASLFITLLNQEEATVMKKLLSLINKEHFNRLTSTIL